MIRIFGSLFLLILTLALIAFALLSLPGFQKWSKAQLQIWLDQQIENGISYSDFDFNIFHGGKINDLLILDHHKDTLIYAKELLFTNSKSLTSIFNNELKINHISLNQSVLRIALYKGEWENGLDLFIRQFDRKSKEPRKKKKPFEIGIHHVQINQSRHIRIREDSGIKEEYFIHSANLEIGALMLPANYFYFKEVHVSQSSIHIQKSNPTPQDQWPKAPERDSSIYYCRNPFILYFGKILITQSDFHYSDLSNKLPTTSGGSSINYKQFSLHDITTDVRNFQYSNLEGTGAIQLFSCDINQSKKLLELSSKNIKVSRTEMQLNDFKFETEQSLLKDTLHLYYTQYSDFLTFNDDVILDFKTHSSKINVSDISFFVESASRNSFFQNNESLCLNLEGEIVGRVNSLKGFGIQASVKDELKFEGDFSIRNTTQRGREFLDIKIDQLNTQLEFLSRIIPNLKIPDPLKNIGSINYRGNFTGYFEDFVSYGSFTSTLGKINSDIRLNLRPGIAMANFSGDLRFDQFDLGRLFKNEDLGYANFNTYIKNGKGLTLQSIHADLKANIANLGFKKYDYKNIAFDGNISPDHLNGKIVIKDKNLDVDFTGKISNFQKEPNLNFTAILKKADLKELKLSDVSIIVSADVQADFRNTLIDHLDGDLNLSKISFYDYGKNKVLSLGDISFTQQRKNKILSTEIKSNFLNASISGEYRTAGVYNQLISYLQKHYGPFIDFLKPNVKNNTELYSYHGYIKGQNLYRIFHFMDWDVQMDQFMVDINNDFRSDSIFMKISIDQLSQGKITIPYIGQTISGNSSLLTVHTNSPSILFNKKAVANEVDLKAIFSNDRARVLLYSKDSSRLNTLYDLGINILLAGKDKYISFVDPNVILHGKNWKINESSKIEIYQTDFEINNFSLEDSTSKIEIDDKGRQGLRLLFVNLNLNSLNRFIGSPTVQFEGLFDSRIDIKNIYKLEDINAIVNISNLRVNQNNYGRTKIDFGLSNPMESAKLSFSNQYKETKVEGKGTFNLPLTGKYKLPKYELDLNFNIHSFPISFLENFISSIQNTQGSFNGEANLKYSNKKLTAKGELITKDGSTNINYLNTAIKFDEQKIILDGNQIIFNDIILRDELNNPLSLVGILTHKNFVNYSIHANINSPKALILNTSKGQNPYFYGYGLSSVNADFDGPLDRLDMGISARSLKGSKLILPIDQDQVAEENKFIQFEITDTSSEKLPITPRPIKGLSLNMNMDITEDAEIQILFDEKTGDILKGTGRGNLQIQSLRDNTFSIKGSYEIEEGQYLFTLFNFVNKPFKLKRGGTIQWTGDPLDANIQIEASYEKLSVSPAPLLQEYTNLDQVLQQEIRNRTNVDLTMLLTGSLLKPDIHFDLSFPDATGNLKNLLENKLRILRQNPDQLNQQVASLIAFRTFLGTNTGIVTGLSTTTISTMSEFLSNQLSIFVSNLLSEAFENVDFISGVDFNINYDVDKNPLAETRLNEGEVAFSLRHRLWNDQWAVTLGGNYGSNSPILGNAYFNPESVIEWNTPVPGLKMRIYYKAVESLQGLRHRIGAGVSRRKEFDSLLDFKKALKKESQEIQKGLN